MVKDFDLLESIPDLTKISNKNFLSESWVTNVIDNKKDFWLFVRPSLENFTVKKDTEHEKYILKENFKKYFGAEYPQCSIDRSFTLDPLIIVKANSSKIISTLEKMENDSNILKTEFSRPGYLLRESSFSRIKLDAGRNYLNKIGRLTPRINLTIGMVDTGILPAHREFRNKNIITDSVLNDTGRDNIGHGTNVACIMVGDPGIIPEATLLSVKAFDVQHGFPSFSSHNAAMRIVEGIHRCLERGAKIINVSVGHYACPLENDPCEVCRSAELARRMNCVVVAASGDTSKGDEYVTCPAQSSSAIAVGACDSIGDWKLCDTNPRGPAKNNNRKPDFVAPGIGIKTIFCPPTGSSGTSFAAPHVSGALALTLFKYSPFKLENAIKALERNAVVYPYWARPNEQGHGLINLDEALRHY